MIAHRAADIDWYDRFNLSDTAARRAQCSREAESLKLAAGAISRQIARVRTEIARFEGLTAFSFNPKDWFSAERRENKRRLKHHRTEERQLQLDLDANTKRMQGELKLSASLDAECDRYRQFERLRESASLKADVAKLADLRHRLEQEQARKDQIDAKLAEPLSKLAEYRERDRILSDEIDQAVKLEASLDRATNRYERHRIHEQCNSLFGDGSPGKIMRQRRNEVEAVRRSIEKLETRLGNICRASARVVKTVVVDGNNLCYENHKEVIGLGAIEAAVKRLAVDYTVVIVFDAQICAVLRMNHQAINARFKRVAKVHIVSSKRGADETILDAATDKDAYVISNDKFRDFPDKPAVREARVATHSIVNRKIMIHDFDINEQFAA